MSQQAIQLHRGGEILKLQCPTCQHPMALPYQFLGVEGNCTKCDVKIVGRETGPGTFAAELVDPPASPFLSSMSPAPATQPVGHHTVAPTRDDAQSQPQSLPQVAAPATGQWGFSRALSDHARPQTAPEVQTSAFAATPQAQAAVIEQPTAQRLTEGGLFASPFSIAEESASAEVESSSPTLAPPTVNMAKQEYIEDTSKTNPLSSLLNRERKKVRGMDVGPTDDGFQLKPEKVKKPIPMWVHPVAAVCLLAACCFAAYTFAPDSLRGQVEAWLVPILDAF